MGSSALYFKTPKNGYALFFKGIAEGVREEFWNALGLVKETGANATESVRRLDITAQFGAFELDARYTYYTLSWDSLTSRKPDGKS
jgi:hypothetical protein